MTLSDAAERTRALTDLDATLLVEAAAGTGKTAILAGRVVVMLAAGCDPAEIAAITFTELAAGELGQRIRSYAGALLRGEMPAGLELAFPEGLAPRQHDALRASAARLDELTATTIHGFCWDMLQAYAVEADIDPGASVLDAAQADTLFEDVLADWLSERLGDPEDSPDDPIAVLAQDDPLQAMKTVRALAQLQRRHPTARPPDVDLSSRPDIDFGEAVRAFAQWFRGAAPEAKTAAIVEQLSTLASLYADCLATPPSYARLLALSRPPHQPLMLSRWNVGWRAYACRTEWRRLAGDDVGPQLNDEAEAHYAHCELTFFALLSYVAGRLVAGLAKTLREPLAAYDRRKRSAAVIDFDDLLLRARQLLRDHEDVRQAISARRRRLLVDEFQDTDPVQAEIIFSVAARRRPAQWLEAEIGPGALFLVGDPKQAIYGFRGADPATYRAVRAAIERRGVSSVVQLTDNFRSDPAILEHVNARFAEPLSQTGQSGYVSLKATLPQTEDALAGAVALTVFTPPDATIEDHRREEAAAVAALCQRLIGTVSVRRPGGRSPLRPGDIALLAPTGTELWRYERALEDAGLAVASQAGKTLMLRQETQDVLALLRSLADPLDTLAFGALMRGPLVGLTDAELLTITGALPTERPTFSLRTDPADIAEPTARAVLETLRELRRRVGSLTPAALLGEAIERLNIRVALALRMRDRRARALANLNALQELARPFAVRGLAAFVDYLQAAWEGRDEKSEGRSDEDDEAVSLVTIHSSKGLEWPVVIAINTSTGLREAERFVHRRGDDTLHWTLGGLRPPELPQALAAQSVNQAFERERLLYVACTRARDLLVLPKLAPLARETWSRVVDLHAGLANLDLDDLPSAGAAGRSEPTNHQDAATFAYQAKVVSAAAPPVVWRRPSDLDLDRVAEGVVVVETGEPAPDEALRVAGAGRLRGVLLHKLLEELISGETADEGLAERSSQLLGELASATTMASAAELPDPAECAVLAKRTLELPEVAILRSRLAAEVAGYGVATDGRLVAARADAVAFEGGRIDVVLDWKSDVAPSAADRRQHAGQLRDYLAVFDAEKGAVVYASLGEVVWVAPGLT